MGGAVETVKDVVVDPVKDLASDINREVIKPVVNYVEENPLQAAALALGGYGLYYGLGAGTAATAAEAAAEAAFLGADAAQLAAQGLGQAQIAEALTLGGANAFAAADAAQLALQGLSSDAIAQNLTQTLAAPDAVRGMSVTEALRGANLASNLMAKPVQPLGGQIGPRPNVVPQGAVDYNQILSLLGQKPANTAGLLGTQFQPQAGNITDFLKAQQVTSLLG